MPALALPFGMETGAGERGTRETGRVEIGTGEIGTGEIGLLKTWAVDLTVMEIRGAETGGVEMTGMVIRGAVRFMPVILNTVRRCTGAAMEPGLIMLVLIFNASKADGLQDRPITGRASPTGDIGGRLRFRVHDSLVPASIAMAPAFIPVTVDTEE